MKVRKLKGGGFRISRTKDDKPGAICRLLGLVPHPAGSGWVMPEEAERYYELLMEGYNPTDRDSMY